MEMSRNRCFWLGTVLNLLYLIPGIVSWGKDGHYATCKIAEGLLTEEAMSAVTALLPDYAHGDLASVCSWPDEIKRHYQWRWSSPLHYVDTPDFKCNYDYCRDCHDSAGRKDRCVSGAIYNYSSQLATHQHPELEEKYNLTEALLFLSHFMGDIHQDDWSTVVSSWEDCGFNQTVCPNVYASESIRLACKFAYRNATPGSTLGDEYFLSRLPIVEKRLAQGGVRLAATLNHIFHAQPPSISTT